MEGKGWIEALNLQVGDDIRNANGVTGEVESIEIKETSQEMYNLTVDEAHTFFVGDGQWLVHNTDPCVSKALSAGLPYRINDKGPTIGYLFDETGNLIRELTSGRNPYSFDSTLARGKNKAFLIQDHVEAQAAGLMRDLSMSNGTLVLNNIPCWKGANTCEKLLPYMIPEGSSLRIIVPEGFHRIGLHDRIFHGIP